MTGSLAVGDQRGQTRPYQAALVDPGRQGRVMDLPAMRTPPGQATMLLDADRHSFNVNLLHHAWRCRRRLQAVAALGTDLCHIGMRISVEQLGSHQRPFVTRVSGLTPNGTLGLTVRRRG